MSVFEPNTAPQGEPTEESFLPAARMRALAVGIPAVLFALRGVYDYFLWRTWPTHVSLRRQGLGMDWWLHSAWWLWAVAAGLSIWAALLLAFARRTARRSLRKYQRRRQELVDP